MMEFGSAFKRLGYKNNIDFVFFFFGGLIEIKETLVFFLDNNTWIQGALTGFYLVQHKSATNSLFDFTNNGRRIKLYGLRTASFLVGVSTSMNLVGSMWIWV